MTPHQPQPQSLFARDVLCYSDEELDRYLREKGGLVHLEDPENLTESFIERLRSREAAGSTFLSHGIDFDHLARRLKDIPASPASTTSTEESGEDGNHRLQIEHQKKQKECYYKLVQEGGRPSHSISLGREVLQNPDYEEILAWWGVVNDGGHGREWDGFEMQLSAWREFRKWQRSNREEGRFDIYAASVRKSLQKHGFRKPFQLNADPTQQDKLTTWIEYLDYTYYWHNKDLRFLQRLQPQYDEAWSKLQDSKLFLPNETEEFIWSSASVIQHGREAMQAESAVESAKGVISDLESCGRSQHQIHREALAAANSTLESAENELAIIQRRNSLVAKFYIQFGQMRKVNGILQKSYREVQKDARRRSILLRWILQQLPLIELELENDTNLLGGAQRLPPKPKEKKKKPAPQHVLDHAPLVHLPEDEIYWPSLLKEHLEHTTPYDNYLPVNRSEQHPTLDNLGYLNTHARGEHVYLHSRDAVESDPEWLLSAKNTPIDPSALVVINGADGVNSTHYVDLSGSAEDKKKLPKDVDGNVIRRPARSSAPAHLILVEHPDNVVHAFWFFFYSYNLGNSVFGVGFGDHVGDWEHSVVRFKDGKPESDFVSEHAFGQSYTWSAMEKYVEQALASDAASLTASDSDGKKHTEGFLDGGKKPAPEGKRPVIYSGRGTHAMYATPGITAYVLPFTILHDTTSRGLLWDPTLNLVSYHYTSPAERNCTSRNPWHPDCGDRKMTDIPTSPSDSDEDPWLFDSPDFYSLRPYDVGDGFDGSPSLQTQTLIPTLSNPDAPTSWFYYNGRWGHKECLFTDTRQYHAPIVGEKKFVDGPHGPRYKGLGRRDVCPRERCKLRGSRAPRLWVFNWLYNWAWLVGGWVVLTIMGITAILVVKHARRTHRGAWKLYVKYMEHMKTKRIERVKLLANVERSPLLSEASEADDESVVSLEGALGPVEGHLGRKGGYGTISEVDRPRLNQHQEGWNSGSGSGSDRSASAV